MPRHGLTSASVVQAGAELADESGIGAVSLAALAERLNVKPPALYKHVDGIADLRRQIATLAMVELGDSLRDALQGRSGTEAIGALFRTVQSYITHHPGRYSATTGADLSEPDAPLSLAAARVIESCRAALSSYGIATEDLDHATRVLRCTFHGFAMLQASNGFQWSNDPDESVTWMIAFIDAGLSGMGRPPTL